MLHLLIGRSWLFSLAARRIYFTCALLSLAFVATVVGVRVAMTASRISTLDPRTAFLVRVLLYPEILGAALLWIAMWYFWFGFDESHYLKKALWFVCLAVLAPFGTVAYYFVVYRPSLARERIATNPRQAELMCRPSERSRLYVISEPAGRNMFPSPRCIGYLRGF